MSHSNTPPSRSAQALPYATPRPGGPQISGLAIVSLALAILGSPCVTAPLLGALRRYGPYLLVSPRSVWWTYCKNGPLVLITLLPLVAIARIRLSRPRLTGIRIALVALAIAELWWGLALLSWWLTRGWPRHFLD
jgi:hypothetical protein